MREILLEETVEIINLDSANKKYGLFNVLSIFAYVCCLLWFLLVTFSMFELFSLAFLLFGLLPNILLLLGGIFLGMARDSFYVEYDYRFLTGDVNISKVIKGKKRKKGISFRCIDLDKLGVYGTDSYSKIEVMPDVKKYIMTSNNVPSKNKDFYYAVLTRNQEKYLVIMECSKRFISLVISACNKTILDEELKKI